MRRRQICVFLVLSGALAAFNGVALASKPKPITVIGNGALSAPHVLVDARGTINLAWVGTTAGNFETVRYARKPAGATGFTQVALPGDPHLSDDQPFIYEPSPGVLQIFVGDFDAGFYAWRSTNDGASWTSVSTAALAGLKNQNVYIASTGLLDSPGGAVEYAGSTGSAGDVVALNNDFSGVTGFATNSQSLIGLQVARSADGDTFLFGEDQSSDALRFQVGSNQGSTMFPCYKEIYAGAGGFNPVLAAGRSVAVIAFAGCGHVYTRTITSGGVVGPLKTVGASPPTGDDTWVQLIGTRGGFTAAFTTPGGDVDISHSAAGSSWNTASGLVPIAPLLASSGNLSTGATTWYGASVANANSNNTSQYGIRVIPLTDTYKPPRAPSGSGLADPRRAGVGSLAVTVPGGLSVRSFSRNGRVTVKLVGALSDTVSASVSVTRVEGTTTYDICGGSAMVKLKSGRARTVTLVCGSGAIVIGGGGVSAGNAARKGDLVAFGFDGRNGPLAVSSRVG